MKVTTSTGIVLDTEGLWALDATKYAQEKGLVNVIVCVATEPGGRVSYVILQDNQPVYESQSFEGICCRLDMMVLGEQDPTEEKPDEDPPMPVSDVQA